MNNHILDFHNNNNDFKYIELIVFGGWWGGLGAGGEGDSKNKRREGDS